MMARWAKQPARPARNAGALSHHYLPIDRQGKFAVALSTKSRLPLRRPRRQPADAMNASLAAGEIVTIGTSTHAFPIAPGEEWRTRLAGVPLPGARLRASDPARLFRPGRRWRAKGLRRRRVAEEEHVDPEPDRQVGSGVEVDQRLQHLGVDAFGRAAGLDGLAT